MDLLEAKKEAERAERSLETHRRMYRDALETYAEILSGEMICSIYSHA